MLAVIMAGGKGSRLNLGEKPLVTIAGRPMISYVIRAFEMYGCHIVVVASDKTPMTQNWCRVSGIDLFCAKGNGYVEDMPYLLWENPNRFLSQYPTFPACMPVFLGQSMPHMKSPGRKPYQAGFRYPVSETTAMCCIKRWSMVLKRARAVSISSAAIGLHNPRTN
jgi:hypothetical protein